MTAGSRPPLRDGPYCGARLRGGPGTCRQFAGWGTDHVGTGQCKLHGGSTPNARKRAQMERAREAVATFGLPREVAPDVALLEEVHRTAGHVGWLGALVAGLESSELAQWSETGRAPSVWVRIYQEERQHLVRVAKAAIDAGIAERQVRLAEQQGTMLAQVIDVVLDGLGLDERQRGLVPEVVPAALRAIGGAG